jgi:hypothetical protein
MHEWVAFRPSFSGEIAMTSAFVKSSKGNRISISLPMRTEGVSLVVGGERRFVSFYATSC